MQWGDDEAEKRRAHWQAYIESIFSEPESRPDARRAAELDPGLPSRSAETEPDLPARAQPPRSPEPGTGPEDDPDAGPFFQAGMLVHAPLSTDPRALPAGYYIILSDPDGPVVRLCLAGRDADGFLSMTDRTITVSREGLRRFRPVPNVSLF